MTANHGTRLDNGSSKNDRPFPDADSGSQVGRRMNCGRPRHPAGQPPGHRGTGAVGADGDDGLLDAEPIDRFERRLVPNWDPQHLGPQAQGIVVEYSEDVESPQCAQGVDHDLGVTTCTDDPDRLHCSPLLVPVNGAMVASSLPEMPSMLRTLIKVIAKILMSSPKVQ